ncbi:hypothetical protein SUGI_0887270 [Cryptomeria japonica]|uniref:protein DMP6 n=1 Tax=Cryptomeria japonica TaxID=3369 RepID=UPI00241499C9|nr:protein DMP6 [Cryptomeria japonica]GLJ42789.1 hypothetical protein SUGI_0887270 [Cryptomeria japonica]
MADISARLNEREASSILIEKTRIEKMADIAFASAANLVKLLPTTTVLTFQVLSPTFTNRGQCYTANIYLTAILLACCGISCFVTCFTDSYRSEDGTLYYGFVTKTGLRTMNDGINKTVDLSSYKLRFIDFVHAVLSVVVFASVALMDNNVVNCFYQKAQENAEQLLKNLPLGAGFACSMFFMAFPTTRHGIGYAA